jgi:hypothetical protein
MPTNYKKAPLVNYQFIYQTITVLDGYYYFAYQHASGQVIIARQKSDESEMLYADGGFDLASAWADKVDLNYVPYAQL